MLEINNHTTTKTDPLEAGIPNVNFSLNSAWDPNDNRHERYKRQRLERGFDDTELWSLDATIAKFMVPRLRAFRENLISHPPHLTSEQWQRILDQMIKGFSPYLEQDSMIWGNRQYNSLRVALRLFAQYFPHLWD
ncbi:MAG: hypothetical protein ABEJ25_08540 [Candidatus Bipolaricaulia bacterium]